MLEVDELRNQESKARKELLGLYSTHELNNIDLKREIVKLEIVIMTEEFEAGEKEELKTKIKQIEKTLRILGKQQELEILDAEEKLSKIKALRYAN